MFSPYTGTQHTRELTWPGGRLGDFGVAIMASDSSWFAITASIYAATSESATILACSPFWLQLMLADVGGTRMHRISWTRGGRAGEAWKNQEVRGIYRLADSFVPEELVIRVRERKLYFADGKVADIGLQELRARRDVEELFRAAV